MPVTCPYPEPDQSSPCPPINLLKIHLNIILPSTPGLSSGFFPSGFPTKSLHTPLLSPIRAACSAHLTLLDFITLTILGEEYRSLSSSLPSFLHCLVTSSLLGPNNQLNTLFSNTVSLRSSLKVSDQVSYTYKTTGKIIIIFTVKSKKNIELFFLAQTSSAYQSTQVGSVVMFDFSFLLPNVHVSLERREMRATKA